MPGPGRPTRSLAGRVAVAIAVGAVAAIAIALVLARWLGTGWLAGATALVIILPAMAWLASWATGEHRRVVEAVRDGIASLRDTDFSISVTPIVDDETGQLARAYNSLGDALRRERLDLHQRELLLDTVVQTTPLALVLTNAGGSIVFANLAARQLFNAGRKLEGLAFEAVLAGAAPALREAVEGGTDTLFSAEVTGDPEVFHLAQRRFTLNGQPHRLLLFKQLTRELAAQEVAIWKRVIRVIAHELSNSLAPISSLAHSGRALAGAGDPARLERVFTTIEDRARHLAGFIDGYARFAKLPRPRPARVRWQALVDGLEGTQPFVVAGPLPPGEAWLDQAQIEQVLINLLKNAAESGSAPGEVVLAVRPQGDGALVEVMDRGSGMPAEVLRDALLPFYSTKPAGTGLGLTLCREIVEAHGGRLSLANREGGGVVVSLWLPGPPALP